MPRLGRIIDVAEELKTSSVIARAERCTHRHHQASTCSLCEQVCPAQAITVSADGPIFDALTCEGCGACASVCPTGAIEPLDPTDAVLVERIATRTAIDDRLTIACARAASPGPGALRVSCLARLDPSLLLFALSKGAVSVSLSTGVCDECPTREVAAHVSSVATDTRRLLEAFGLHGHVALEVGAEHPEPEDEKPAGMTRRGMFELFRRGGAVYAAKTVEGILVEPGSPAPREDPRRESPAHVPAKRERLLEALRALVPEGSALRDAADVFMTPDLDRARCNGCAMCSRICPAGALESAENGDEGEGALCISCRPAACVACGLCVETCARQALSLTAVSAAAVLAPGDQGRTLFERAEGEGEALFATAEDKMKKLLGVPVYRM